MSDENKTGYNFFEICKECETGCCRDVKPPITTERRRIIEDYLKSQAFSIENAFIQKVYTFPREDSEGYCVFYDKQTKRCVVHPVKPETCMAGPITFYLNAKSRKIEWYLKMGRICRLAGRLWEDDRALREHLKMAKREILRLVRELDLEALKALLEIEEPETFKIDEDELDGDVLEKLGNLQRMTESELPVLRREKKL
ncbi:MAG: YkgJ family cysteine cluster protein [Candidatus Bathycorpusculaceae bacterium]